MPDDKTKRTGSDRDRVSLEQDYEVRYWTNELSASREELEEAVKSVGHEVSKVRQHLEGRRK